MILTAEEQQIFIYAYVTAILKLVVGLFPVCCDCQWHTWAQASIASVLIHYLILLSDNWIKLSHVTTVYYYIRIRMSI